MAQIHRKGTAATVKWSRQNICEPGRHFSIFREILVLLTEINFVLSWKKKKKSGWKEEEVGVEIKGPGECSSPSKGQEVSGSWQPRPDEEPGWRHSKPGRARGADGNEERERHSPPKTVTPG